MLVKVENYTRKGQMEKDLTSLLNSGWRIVGQSGSFKNSPLLRGPFAQKVTVTLTQNSEAQGVA